METKQQLQSIIDDGKEIGATHYNFRNKLAHYYLFDNSAVRPSFYHWNRHCEDWDCIDFVSQNIRSLSDIKNQIDLLEKVEQLEQENSKLKAHNDMLCNDLTSICDGCISQLEGKQ